MARKEAVVVTVSEDQFKYESLQDCEAVVRHLKAFTEGIERGSISLATNGRELILTPNGLLRFGIKARRGKYRTRIALRLSWREKSPEEDLETFPLKISHQAAGRNS